MSRITGQKLAFWVSHPSKNIPQAKLIKMRPKA
jgi:hypothetical protein